ncbi:MAG TPA: cysteine hydrolase [Acetobacteraceae bacterium]|nr:cysteine hydrolase [Acetobacteraceae bacterium]
MEIATEGPEIRKSALIVVDMQNDFVHSEGRLGCKSREVPEAEIDMPFLQGTIPQVQRLVDAFREAGRPVVYVAHILKADYSDAQVPYWRFGIRPGEGNHTFIVENTWGAQIVDELKPKEGEHLIIKKGFGGFSNTPLDTVLRNLGVTTCVVSGVTTCVCVSTTVRGGVDHNYHVILVKDAVAEVNRRTHEAELETMARVFADVKTTEEVVAMLPPSA